LQTHRAEVDPSGFGDPAEQKLMRHAQDTFAAEMQNRTNH
jgi:hypothetical protein